MKIISYWTNLWNPTHDSSNKKKTQSPPLHERKKRACRDRLSTARPTSQRVPHRKHWDALRYDGSVVGYTPRARGNPPFLSIFMSFPAINLCFGWGIGSNGQVSNNFVFSPCHFKHMSLPYESKLGSGKWATWRNDHQPPKTISWLHGYILFITMLNLHNKNILHDKPSLCCNTTTVTHTHIATNTKNGFIMKLP